MQKKVFLKLSLSPVFLFTILFQMTGFGLADTLSLQKSISMGVLTHPAVLSARGELKAASGSVWKSFSPPSPVLRVENAWDPRGSNISDYGEQTIGISQSLDFPLLTYFGVKSAHYARQSASSVYHIALAQTSAEITIAYLDIWLAQQKVSIAESLHQAIERLATGAKLKYDVGEGTSIERDRLKAQAEQSNRSLQKTTLELTLAKLQLAQLIGRHDDTSFQVSDPGRLDSILPDISVKPSNSYIFEEA